jgi:hypothetical protein
MGFDIEIVTLKIDHEKKRINYEPYDPHRFSLYMSYNFSNIEKDLRKSHPGKTDDEYKKAGWYVRNDFSGITVRNAITRIDETLQVWKDVFNTIPATSPHGRNWGWGVDENGNGRRDDFYNIFLSHLEKYKEDLEQVLDRICYDRENCNCDGVNECDGKYMVVCCEGDTIDADFMQRAYSTDYSSYKFIERKECERCGTMWCDCTRCECDCCDH